MVFKNEDRIFLEKEVSPGDGPAFPVLVFAAWENLPGLRHCFTTRAGGVSEGFLSSLNFRREDAAHELEGFPREEPAHVLENFRRAACYFGAGPDRIVCAHQTHTANVRVVTEADAGKGVTRDRDYADVDALVTNVPGLILFTSHADCVPLYFFDPVHRAIALAHSGWKGTVARIGARTIQTMREAYGTDPDDLYAAIGPSICTDCYEVSEDVAEAVRGCFALREGFMREGTDKWNFAPLRTADAYKMENAGGADTEVAPRILRRGRMPGKYQFDLWQANARILVEAGVRPARLTITNLCTCENAGQLFSHRATCGRRGNQGAFLMLMPAR